MTIPSASLTAAVLLSFTLPSAAADVELWRLDCGTIEVQDLSTFSDAFRYGGESRTLTDSCYLVRHDDSYLLWDAGLPTALLDADPSGQAMGATLARSIDDQLGDIGVATGAISMLGISHYHFDHVGQAAAFGEATLLIGADDFTAIHEDPLPFGADPSLLAAWLEGGGSVIEVAGDHDIFGDGSVVMLDMPGHTPGSYALLVRLADTGPVLLSGDVAHFEEQIDNRGVPPFNVDRADSLASMERLADMAQSLNATLVVQHDASHIDRLPAFPASAR